MRSVVVTLQVIFMFCFFNIQGQSFIADFYFEDSEGRKDTLIIGEREFGVNNNVENILNQDLDTFDVRLVGYIADNPNAPVVVHGDCDHQAGSIFYDDEIFFGEIEYEAKEQYASSGACQNNPYTGINSEIIIPVTSSFPITITWDAALFQDSCRSNSYLSEMPFSFAVRDSLWCEDRINHPKISLKDSNSIILEEPNFLTFRRRDSIIVSVYYLFLTNNNFTGDIIDNTKNVLPHQFEFYPNPVQDRIYLESIDQDFQYQIYNLQGQQIQQGVYRENIEVARLSSGIYFLQLSKEGELYQAIKFVKK